MEGEAKLAKGKLHKCHREGCDNMCRVDFCIEHRKHRALKRCKKQGCPNMSYSEFCKSHRTYKTTKVWSKCAVDDCEKISIGRCCLQHRFHPINYKICKFPGCNNLSPQKTCIVHNKCFIKSNSSVLLLSNSYYNDSSNYEIKKIDGLLYLIKQYSP